MPDLPRIFAAPNIPFSGPQAQTTPHDFGAGVFHTLAQVTEGMRQKQLPIEAAQLESQYNIAVSDLKNKIMAENPDPLNWRGAFQAEEASLRKSMSDNIQDKEVQKVFNFQAARSYDNHIIDISTTGIKASHERQQIGVKSELSDIARQYGAAQTDKERGELMSKASGLLLSASTPLDSGGRPIPPTYSPQEVVALQQEFLKAKDVERVGWMAEKQPAQLLELLKDPKQFPTLDAGARHSASVRANESINLAKAAANQVEKERLDNLNKDVLFASALPGANLIALRENVLKNKQAFDFHSYKGWTEYLDRAIKAQEAGEDSPFFKSQGDILGQVMKGVLEEPEKWSTTDITRYIGKGLSAAHGKELSEMLDARKKDKGLAGPLTPMAQARTSWEEQRKIGAFLNADERKIFNGGPKDDVRYAATVAENDRRAQAVLDKMILAEKNTITKVDPRKVFQTEMQPFYNQTVTSWGEFFLPGSGGFFSGTRARTPEEIRAAQERAFAGQDPTQPGPPTRTPPGPGASAAPTMTTPQLAVLVPKVKEFYRQTFGKELPVSAEGQSGTHDKMGFDHSNAMDVAVNPTTKEGRALIVWLDSQKIPYIAFDRAVPGQATGPHIHIGNPSPRLAQR